MRVHDDLETLLIPIDTVRPYHKNPRQGDIGAISQSLEANGQYKPIVINRGTHASHQNEIVAGNHTWHAAKALGWDHIAATFVDVTDEQAARIVVVDNRTTDLATYDDSQLAGLLTELAASPDGLEGTGYDGDDLDDLLAELADVAPIPVPEPTEYEQRCKLGDVWTIGPHRLIIGDCRDPVIVAAVTDGAPVNVAFTSPPYADRRKYKAESGFKPIPPGEYVEWFRPVADNMRNVLAVDGSWFVNIKAGANGLDQETYVLDLVLAHAREWGWHWVTELCWERLGVPKNVTRRFKNQFEPVYHFALNDFKMRAENVRHASENVPVGTGGNTSWDGTVPGRGQGHPGGLFGTKVTRRRANSSVKSLPEMQGTGADVGAFVVEGMAYPGNRLPTFMGSHEATGHTAAFPIGLPAFFVQAYSDPGDHIIDPFVGSGSTMLAAHQHDRIGLGIELSSEYGDITLARFETHHPDLPIERAN